MVQWNSNLADWTGQHQIVRYFGVVRYFWTSVLLHKLTIFLWKLHICHFWQRNKEYGDSIGTSSQIMMSHLHYSFRITHTKQKLLNILKKDPIFGQSMMVFTINLKFFVRYIGVFGFPNCQKSAKFGPIYFNKNWSAEKCPLNWSCPLFLESAKLEFHCTFWHPQTVLPLQLWQVMFHEIISKSIERTSCGSVKKWRSRQKDAVWLPTIKC